MGTNTLSVATDGQVIPAAHHNELVTAIGGDFVPRNASRVPQDIIGQLGTSALRWLRTYSNEYYIGAAAQNLKIYEGASGEIWIERNASNKELIKLKNGSIEVIVNNVLVGNFQQTTLTTPNEYLSYDAIKQKTKIVFANIAAGYSSGYSNIHSSTLTGCIAGKKIYMQAGVTYNDAGALTSADFRFMVNGVQLREWSDQGQSGINQSIFAVYNIPSNGSYTIALQYRDCEVLATSQIFIQEI